MSSPRARLAFAPRSLRSSLSYCETLKLNSASGPILLPAGGDCVKMMPCGPLPALSEVTPATLKPAFSRL